MFSNMKNPFNKISRRKAIGTTALAGLASTISNNAYSKQHLPNTKIKLAKGSKIYFRGTLLLMRVGTKKPSPKSAKAFGKGYVDGSIKSFNK